MRKKTLLVSLAIALMTCITVMMYVEAGLDTAGVELGPDHTQQARPGQNVMYDHVLTNTGTTTHTFSVDVLSTQGWSVALRSPAHPTETQVLTLQVGAQLSTTLQVSLTVPSHARGVTEATLITATSQLSPTVRDTATDTTFVAAIVHLPLVMNRYPPLPYRPTINPISNPDGDGSYRVSWTEQPPRLADEYTLEEATNSAFTDDVRQVCTTFSQGCNVTGRLAGTYYYRVQGHNSWGDGQYSSVRSVEVLVPVTPWLKGIDNADGDGSYTVSWATAARATWYQLQRDKEAVFSAPAVVYQGSEHSWEAAHDEVGRFHYRLRALGPTGHSDWSNTRSVTVVATPHNPRAQDIVLALSDMPSGYELNQEKSGPLDPGEAAVGAYEVWYEDWDLLFWGTPVVVNISTVFKTEDGARGYMERTAQGFDADPDYAPLSCRTFGDETIAYRQVVEEDGTEIVVYIILFRQDNLTAVVITDGLLGIAEFDTTLSFAQKVLDRLNSQIAASNPAEGQSPPWEVLRANVDRGSDSSVGPVDFTRLSEAAAQTLLVTLEAKQRYSRLSPRPSR